MQDKFMPTSAGKIHAMVAGKGDAILLVHGRSKADNSWRTWQRNIDSLASNYRVYALELLGYGESDQPEHLLDA